MTKIQINVLNREYTIQCQDGEEQKVQELAEKLNSQMNELQQKIPMFASCFTVFNNPV